MRKLRETLLGWYAAFRRDLPWRRSRDPYAIWLSEIMLQQTRVETVIPYFARFLARFPDVRTLAAAPEADVLAAWSGLGYYRRARLLHRGAKVVADAGGDVPRTRAALLDVPGIGRYTAGAIASIAFGEAVGLVDGNVARVLARLFAIEDDVKKSLKRFERLADTLVSPDDPGAFNQALMELGATVCTPRSPRCDACPVASMCQARAEGRQASLPVVSAKAASPTVAQRALVLVRGSAFVLMRRSARGIFAGLWEPPRFEATARAETAALRQLGVRGASRVGGVVHVLTHRRLEIDVLVATAPKRLRCLDPDYEEVRLVAPGELGALGVATLARKILRAADVHD